VNGAELLVEALVAEGVTQVYGLPGTTIMDVLDALARRPAIRYLSVRHEQVAAFMADGFGRATGEVGVCLASRGPGAANMATAIANAHDESVPLLAIVGQVADEIVERGAFEEMDLLGFFRPITKWCVQVPRAARIPELVQRAVRVATSGRPGPVVVSLPLDVLTTAVPEPNVPIQPRLRLSPPYPDPEQVRDAARLLSRASRPVLLLGGGVAARPHPPAVVELAEVLGAPVVTAWARKNRFPNGHPHFLGALGNGALAVTESAIRDADAILALGCRFAEFTTRRWTLVSPGTALVHVDIDPAELGRVYVPDVALHAGAVPAAAALCGALRDRPAEPPLRDRRAAWLGGLRDAYLAERVLPDSVSSGSVSSAALTRALGEVLRRQPATLVLDAPSMGAWVQRYLDFDTPASCYASAGGTMAWGFPAAMGIALARPDERVVCVSGDGSFWMVAQDLETAVREDIPVVNVVANNFAYGNPRDRQRLAHGGRYLGVFYDNPDLAAFAGLLGAYGERVERAEDLVPAITRALTSGRPAIVDVIQDRHQGLPPGLAPPSTH
jgi:acetolactate synthase-1/2/3 large subunit